jgi:hypothetical protein
MTKTEFWNRFGNTILDAPHLTLAAFLGHAPSIEVANRQSIRFPTPADFQSDRAYDPNYFKLDLDDDYLRSSFLILCISAWGGEALIRAVNKCSQLQCLHHDSCSPTLKPLRDEVALALHKLVDAPTPNVRQSATELLRRCQELYRPHEDDPDSDAASMTWLHLGAPWFGLETVLGNLCARQDCGETEPGPSNSTWCARETVWPIRAINAAAHWSSHSIVRETVQSTLLNWATDQIEMK